MNFILLLITLVFASPTSRKEKGLILNEGLCRTLRDFHLTKDENSTKIDESEIDKLNHYCIPGKFDEYTVKHYIKDLVANHPQDRLSQQLNLLIKPQKSTYIDKTTQQPFHSKLVKRSSDKSSSKLKKPCDSPNTPKSKKNKSDDIEQEKVPLGTNDHTKHELTELLLKTDALKSDIKGKTIKADKDGYITIKPKENAPIKKQNENIPANNNDPSTYIFDPNKPSGFAEHFSLLLNKIPKEHSTNNPGFFRSMILGAVSSMKSDNGLKVYAKINDNNVKLCFKNDKKQQLILRSFGITKKYEFTSKEIEKLATYGKIESIESFFMGKDRSLSIKSSECTTKNQNKQKSSDDIPGFTKILHIPDTIKTSKPQYDYESLKDTLNDLSSDDLELQKIVIKKFSQKLLQIYTNNKELLKKIDNSEIAATLFNIQIITSI